MKDHQPFDTCDYAVIFRAEGLAAIEKPGLAYHGDRVEITDRSFNNNHK